MSGDLFEDRFCIFIDAKSPAVFGRIKSNDFIQIAIPNSYYRKHTNRQYELTEGEYCVLPEPLESQKAVVNHIREEIRKTEEAYHKALHHNHPDEHFWNAPHSKLKH